MPLLVRSLWCWTETLEGQPLLFLQTAVRFQPGTVHPPRPEWHTDSGPRARPVWAQQVETGTARSSWGGVPPTDAEPPACGPGI